MAEPNATALLLMVLGTLLVISVLFSRASERFSLPLALGFLAIGMLAGSEGIGKIPFGDFRLAFRLGTVALIFILFDGGLNTPVASVRQALRPAAALATVGVAATAGIVASAARALGAGWPEAFLIGAIVSSTDAAAVFSVLRGSGLSLKRRVGTVLEVESGINDPMAVILTTTLTATFISTTSNVWGTIASDVVIEMAVGAMAGVGVGLGARWLLARVRLLAGGLYPVLTVAVACLAFAIPTLLHGSGLLAVYIAAVILGNSALPYRVGLLRVHDALAWLSQIAMFLVLGLLVIPSRLLESAPLGLVLALVLAFIARPIAAALCLLPFRFPAREVAFVGWVGLRGAVPIVLATVPLLAGAAGASRIFHIVFFIVVVNAILPGATVPWVTRRLGLESRDPPRPPAVLEIESLRPLTGELLSFYIEEPLAVTGMQLADLPFPNGSSITLIVRDRDLVAPNGNTVLQTGDHVYVFTKAEDRGVIELMFGRPESS